MNTQDSQSELEKIGHIVFNAENEYEAKKLSAHLIEAYVTTQVKEAERLARMSELDSLLKTTNYDDVPYFVGITAEFIDQRIKALGNNHEWKANDTLSVFNCSQCGMVAFAPHPLPEYGCTALTTTTNGKEE